MTIQEKGLGGYKWRLVAFLFVAFFIAQGARQLYNAALPQICIEFGRMGVTDAQLGAVGSVFGAVFGLAVVVAGIAAVFLEMEWGDTSFAVVILARKDDVLASYRRNKTTTWTT